MITKIGIAAGEIINFLEGKEFPVSIKTISERMDEREDILLMSIGWLAREGFIQLGERDGVCHVLGLTRRCACD